MKTRADWRRSGVPNTNAHVVVHVVIHETSVDETGQESSVESSKPTHNPRKRPRWTKGLRFGTVRPGLNFRFPNQLTNTNLISVAKFEAMKSCSVAPRSGFCAHAEGFSAHTISNSAWRCAPCSNDYCQKGFRSARITHGGESRLAPDLNLQEICHGPRTKHWLNGQVRPLSVRRRLSERRQQCRRESPR
jgi:hypothetical protein